MRLSEHSVKHAEAIIKHCIDNGMVKESSMGLWNHLVKVFSKLDKFEGREPRPVNLDDCNCSEPEIETKPKCKFCDDAGYIPTAYGGKVKCVSNSCTAYKDAEKKVIKMFAILHLSEEEAEFLAILASRSLSEKFNPAVKREWAGDDYKCINYINQYCQTFGYIWNAEERKFSKPV